MTAIVGLKGVLIRDLTCPDRGRLPDAVEDCSDAGWDEFQSLRSRFHRPLRVSPPAPAAAKRLPRTVGRQLLPPTLGDVMAICRTNDRICPLPAVWEKMYLCLPVERRGATIVRAPFPIERRRWNLVSDLLKQERLREQFLWADARGGLFGVQRFLAEMREPEWHHHTPLAWPTLELGDEAS